MVLTHWGKLTLFAILKFFSRDMKRTLDIVFVTARPHFHSLKPVVCASRLQSHGSLHSATPTYSTCRVFPPAEPPER